MRAGRIVNALRSTTLSACSSTRAQSRAKASRRGLMIARAQCYSPPNVAQVAIDTLASPLDKPLALETQPHGKRAYASSGHSRETQTRSDEQIAPDLVTLPPVKLKSTTWMETVDAEAEELDDWDDPLHLVESEIDHGRLDVEAETSTGGSGPDQPSALDYTPDGTPQQGVFVLPDVGTITFHEKEIVLDRETSGRPLRLSYSRLREACVCKRCRDPSTKQRTWTLGEVRKTMRREGWLEGDVADHSARIHQTGKILHVKWDDHWHPMRIGELVPSFLPPRPRTRWILEHHIPRTQWSTRDTLLGHLAQRSGKDVDDTTPVKIDYRRLFPGNQADKADKEVLLEVLTQAHKFGFSIIGGVPTTQTDNRDCQLRQVAEAIGPIRHTFYGETWDVRSQRDSKNVAYTDLNLGLHMDLLYHTEPPRYQLLHCLRNRVQGGESYFVDGFGAARHFKQEHPDKADLLIRHRLVFEYHNDGHTMDNQFAILPDSLRNLRSAIAWSPPFQGDRRAPCDPEDEMFLDAVACFEGILTQSRRRLEFKMAEGDLVIFDNRRVLHARRAFRDWTDEEKQRMGMDMHAGGEPQRWLKGCYLDGDTVWDKLVTLWATKHRWAS